MENKNPGGIDHNYLADLIDDFTPAELVSMLNYFAIMAYTPSRANVKGFRKNYLKKPM